MPQVNNLSARITNHHKQIKASIDRVMSSGLFILGPEVMQFERSFASYLGARHCVSLASGTDAIELGLKAMGVGAGDYVATVANAGMYTTTAMLAIGAEPYFMDVDLDTRVATLEEVTRAVKAGVKAVVVTHLYGLAIPEIARIAKYCTQNDVLLLEDCAQAHGAQVKGKMVGTFGDAGSYSFYPTKNLGALGDGGAVVTNNPNVAEKIALLRQYGWIKKYEVQLLGARNSRLDEVQAAILSDFLPHLDNANARRREIAIRYNSLICQPDIAVPHNDGTDYVAHLYVIRSKRRDSLREHLRNLNIGSDIHYPIPDHRQPAFAGRFSKICLENTELLVNEVLTLPCYPELNDEEVDSVIKAVNCWAA
jgi:dTDP-4-amino-4,6-dideoxygalactose transaminase